MLVEAAWVISGVPGPLRAFFMRIRDKRGKHVAAVATARKLAVIVWHMLTKDEDYAWSRPALLDWKLRKLELTAGYPSHRGGRAKGSAADYRKGARAPHMRCDDHGLRDRVATSTLFFATRSPEPRQNRQNQLRRSIPQPANDSDVLAPSRPSRAYRSMALPASPDLAARAAVSTVRRDRTP
jgi:hypothetical protein